MQTATPVADLTMTYLGLLTGNLTVNDLQVTTTEQAPKNAILIHPSTLTAIANASNGLLDLVRPSDIGTPVELPITVQATSLICMKVLGDVEELTEDELSYISRVLELPEDDINHRVLDVTHDIRDIVRGIGVQSDNRTAAGIQSVGYAPIESPQVVEVEENEINPVCDNCLDMLEDVFNTVEQFVDEYGITGPGYIDIDYNKDVTDDILKESVNRFRENELASSSPSFQESLSKSLAIEVARNLIYEKFITELAEKVGFAEDGDSEDEGLLFGV